MGNVFHSAGSRIIRAGQRVQCLYKGTSYVGVVLHADYKLNEYTVNIHPQRGEDVVLSRKRHQLEPCSEFELKDCIDEVNYLEDVVNYHGEERTLPYQVEEYVHLGML